MQKIENSCKLWREKMRTCLETTQHKNEHEDAYEVANTYLSNDYDNMKSTKWVANHDSCAQESESSIFYCINREDKFKRNTRYIFHASAIAALISLSLLGCNTFDDSQSIRGLLQNPMAAKAITSYISMFKDVKAEKYVSYMFVTGKDDPWADKNLTESRAVSSIVSTTELIQKDTRRSWVDFANAQIGGATLSGVTNQEETMFWTAPELIISMFLFPRMQSRDAIIIEGAQQYVDFEGFNSRNFEVTGILPLRQEETFEWGKETGLKSVPQTVIAIDASCGDAYNESVHLRNINKAYVGFSNTESRGISTGAWGCGAFGGKESVMILVQAIAAALADKDIAYSNLADNKSTSDLIQNINGKSVSKLWSVLKMIPSKFSSIDKIIAELSKDNVGVDV